MDIGSNRTSACVDISAPVSVGGLFDCGRLALCKPSHSAYTARQRLTPNVTITTAGSSHQAWILDWTNQNVTAMATVIDAAIVQSSPTIKSYQNLRNALM